MYAVAYASPGMVDVVVLTKTSNRCKTLYAYNGYAYHQQTSEERVGGAGSCDYYYFGMEVSTHCSVYKIGFARRRRTRPFDSQAWLSFRQVLGNDLPGSICVTLTNAKGWTVWPWWNANLLSAPCPSRIFTRCSQPASIRPTCQRSGAMDGIVLTVWGVMQSNRDVYNWIPWKISTDAAQTTCCI